MTGPKVHHSQKSRNYVNIGKRNMTGADAKRF